MRVELIVALVASGSALIVSLLTGLAQLLQIRSNHRLELARRIEQRASEASGKTYQENQDGLREACKAVQGVQDAILLLIKTPPDSAISKNQKKRLLDARDQLLATYRDYHSILGENDRASLDKARKKVVDMLLRLEIEQRRANDTLSLSEQLVNELERASVVLGNYHQQLLFSAVNAMQVELTSRRLADGK